MKRSRPSIVLSLLNGYNMSLAIYLVLRFMFGSRWWWLGAINTFAFWLFAPTIVTVFLAWGKRSKRQFLISTILLLIGALRFAPLPVGYITASESPHDLRILTFNLWNKNPAIEQTIDWVLAQNADVVILQELVDEHLNQVPRLSEQYPYREYVAGSVQIFSRYPFLEQSDIWLEPATVTNDGRLAVRTVINFNGQAITVYGVHLSLPYGATSNVGFDTGIDFLDFVLHYDETSRNAQLINLAELVQQETNPVIIAGDFNTSHTSPILERLSSIGMTDAFTAVGKGWGMTWSHNPPAPPLIRIDYVWSSGELNPLRMQRGENVGSDHFPLVVDFIIMPNP